MLGNCLRGSLLVTTAALLTLGGCAMGQKKTAHSYLLLPAKQGRKAGLQEAWQLPLGLRRFGHDAIAGIYPENGKVYLSTQRGYLISIDASSGTVNWRRQVGNGVIPMRRPADLRHKKRVLVATSGNLLYLNRQTGQTLHQFDLHFPPGTPPLVASRTVLIGSLHAKYFGLFYADPRVPRWAQPHRHDSFVSRPVLLPGDRIVFASRNGRVWKRDVLTGHGGWPRRVDGGVTAPLSADGGNVYVPCTNGQLYAFNISTGDNSWYVQLRGSLRQGAVPAGRIVVQEDGDHGLVGISAASGNIKWGPVAGLREVVGHAGRYVYAAGLDHAVHVLNVRTGKRVGKVALPGALHFAHRIRGASIYVTTDKGVLVKLTPRAR